MSPGRATSLASTLLLLGLPLLLPLTSSQAVQYTLLPSTLPECASQCSALTIPANNCVPPTAPVTSNTQYISCFCSFSTLSTMLTAATQNLCTGTCSDADWATIDGWYKGVCKSPGSGTGTDPTATTTTTPADVGTTSATPTTEGTPGSATVSPSSNSPSSWWAGHWHWVVMVIVIAIGLGLIGGLWAWLHKRHLRRSEANHNPGNRSTPIPWGASQHGVSAPFNAAPNNMGTESSEKGKGKEAWLRGMPPRRADGAF